MRVILFLTLFLMFQHDCRCQITGLTITGNPRSANGATWTYADSVDGTWYDLQGILFIPPSGNGPFPSVILNHGTGGNVNGYSRNMAVRMVQWDFICIATNLCHSGGVPVGAPGDTAMTNWGASNANYLRDMKCRDILFSLAEVDTNCIMSFGHSRGAFTTTGLVATYPGKFACAGHTAGGATTISGSTAPSVSLAAQIITPYIIHHGDMDSTVHVGLDSSLNEVMDSTGVPHEFHVFPGYTHQQIALDSSMLALTHDWFSDHACLISGIQQEDIRNSIHVFPNPVSDKLMIVSDAAIQSFELVNACGEKILSIGSISQRIELSCAEFPTGLYYARMKTGESVVTKKIIIMD
jgi:dienelactone hydrolase